MDLKRWGWDKIVVTLCSICFVKPLQTIDRVHITYPWFQLYYYYVLCVCAVLFCWVANYSISSIHHSCESILITSELKCSGKGMPKAVYLLHLIKTYTSRKNIKESNNSFMQNGVTMNTVSVVNGSQLKYISHLIAPVMNSTKVNHTIHIWH